MFVYLYVPHRFIRSLDSMRQPIIPCRLLYIYIYIYTHRERQTCTYTHTHTLVHICMSLSLSLTALYAALTPRTNPSSLACSCNFFSASVRKADEGPARAGSGFLNRLLIYTWICVCMYVLCRQAPAS